MVVQCIMLHNFHWLQLLKTCFLCYFILALVSIMLKMTHIGDITYIAYLIAEILKITEQHVECYCRTGMTKMCRAIYCRATNIHTHIRRMQRLKELFFASERVVYHEFIFHIAYILYSFNNISIFSLLWGTYALRYGSFSFVPYQVSAWLYQAASACQAES